MNKLSITIFAALAGLMAAPARGGEYISQVWQADMGNGNYRNPIINADYSDPDVCRVGDDFYMTASSFTNLPGLPILHSKDLVNWTIVNYAVEKLEPSGYFNRAQHGGGIWAPSIRHHNGEFYIYWGDPDHGIYMVKSSDPLGKWEAPVLVAKTKGVIDPCPLWDSDGRAYLVCGWAKSRSGLNSVLTVAEMAPDGKSLIGDPVAVYDGMPDGNHTVEGPKFYKRGDWYYILAPAGGVATGWQLALRSKSPYGPYEQKVVMAQGKTDINGPHQGAWIDTPDGKEDWFIHFQDRGVIGRVIHLNPVKWTEDWPVIGVDKDGDGCGEPVKTYKKPAVAAKVAKSSPQESDDFNTTELGKQWQWFANYRAPFGFATPYGYYRLYGQSAQNFVNMRQIPNILTQKFPNDTFTATAKVTVSGTQDGQESGIIIMGRDYARLAVEKRGDNFEIKLVECIGADQNNHEKSYDVALLPASRLNCEVPAATSDIDLWLRVKVGKDYKCTFSYSTDGKRFIDCGHSFTAREGHWIGARVGFFSIMPQGHSRGWIDIDSFTITK